MPEPETTKLLRQALALFNDGPNFALRGSPSQTSHRLAAKIETFLASASARIANDQMLSEVRERWGRDAGVRIDDEAVFTVDAEGLWICGWLRTGAPIAPIDPAAYERALASLSPIAREVFLLNRQAGLTYDAIGRRLGLSPSDVEREFTTALTGLHRKLLGPDD